MISVRTTSRSLEALLFNILEHFIYFKHLLILTAHVHVGFTWFKDIYQSTFTMTSNGRILKMDYLGQANQCVKILDVFSYFLGMSDVN